MLLKRDHRRYVVSFLFLSTVPAIQFASFLLAGRMLGVSHFGILITFQASAAVFVEVAGFGMSERLIRNVARNPESYQQSLYDFWTNLGSSGLVALLLHSVVMWVLFGHDTLLLYGILFGVAEIFSQRVVTLWEHVAIAHRNTMRADLTRLVPGLLRFSSVMIVYQLESGSLGWVLVAYSVAGVVSAFGLSFLGLRRYGAARRTTNRAALREGAPFALNQILRASQQSLDRLVLNAVLSPAAVAIYASAMKFIQVGSLPVTTILRISFPQVFAAGKEGKHASLSLAKKLLKPAVVVSMLSSTALIVGAPILPLLLGEEYAASVRVLQAAAPALIVIAVGYVGADILTGGDRQYHRVGFTSVALLIQTVLLMVLAPLLGPMGGVIAFYGSLSVFCILCWIAALYGNQNQKGS